MEERTPPQPSRSLSVADMVAIIIGCVIGAGIFKFPSLVALHAGSGAAMVMAWVAGGVVSVTGALCYAELASTYPSAGGDYHFLDRAFGEKVSFLFAWARMMVIQPGSIALLGFIIGEEVARFFPLGRFSPSIYASAFLVALTAVNIAGIREGKWVQKFLAAGIFFAIMALIVIGLLHGPQSGAVSPSAAVSVPPLSGIGMAMILVLFAYSGWNESAYVSAEVAHPRRNVILSLLTGLGIISVVYVLFNWSLLRVLGLEQMRKSDAPQKMVELALGGAWVPLVSAVVVLAAANSMNASVMMGGRSNYALGCDYPLFRAMGKWKESTGTPAAGLVVQMMISLALILFGTMAISGLNAMIDYTSPVFWFFFLMSGIALPVLRRNDPAAVRVFRTPLYPAIPGFFILSCVCMFLSSLLYTKSGALVGVLVLLVGVPVYFLARRRTAR